jgi:UDP-perosamine 4-acetyltransferase
VASGERLLVWGAGGHGRVVADLVRASGHVLAGFVDSDLAKHSELVMPERALLSALRNGNALPGGADAVVPAIGDNSARLEAAAVLGSAVSPALVHPGATVSPSASIDSGSVVCPRAVVNAGAIVGLAAIVNSAAIVEHDCVVEAGVHVSPGAVLAGGTRIGRRAWVGAGAVVIPGVCIGADAIIGAGAVVIRDVPDGATVVGNPARIIRHSQWKRDGAVE